MTERDQVRQCGYCYKEKPWIFSGKKLKDGTKIHTNDRRQRWAGRRCPECERLRVSTTLRWDKFERELVTNKLQEAGYEILDMTPPITVRKGGKIQRVGMRHAAVNNERLEVGPLLDDCELHALVFSSIRLCSQEQIEQVVPK